MIETVEVKNQSEHVIKLGISRARVCQVFVILKLDEKLMPAIKQLGNPIHDPPKTVVPVQPAWYPSYPDDKNIIISE